MCRFLVYIGDNLCYSTLNNYVSALNALGKYFTSSFDLRQDYGVVLLLKGFRRIKGDISHPKDPLTPHDLRLIAQKVDFSDSTQLVIWLIILLAFRTLLRKSHFVSANLDDREHLLRVKDLTFTTWGCSFDISSSKTIQFGQRTFTIPVNFAKHPLCAVTLLKSYLASHKKSGNDYLFTLPKLGLATPVSYDLALQQLKSWCLSCGILKDIGFHSLRRGSASYMYSLDIGLASIQQAGDWQSMCVLRYLSIDFDQKRKIEDLVSSSL